MTANRTSHAATSTNEEVRDGQATLFVPMAIRHRMIVLALFFCYCVALVVVGGPEAEAENWYLYLAVWLYVGLLALPIIMYRDGYGWLHPLILNALLTTLVLARSFPVFALGLSRHVALPSYDSRGLTSLLTYKLVLMSIAQCCLLVGYSVSSGIWAPRVRTRPWNGVFIRTSIIVTLAGSLAGVYIFSRGGLSTFILLLGKSRHVALEGQWYMLYPALLAFPALMIGIASQPTIVRRPWFWAVAAVALLIEPLLTFGRSSLVFGVFSLLLVHALSVARMPFGRGLVAGIVGIYAITLLGDLRASTQRNKLESETSKETFEETMTRGWNEHFVARGTAADGALPILARVPNDIDLLYGEGYLAVLASPVPRTLWSEKPSMVGSRVGRTFFHTTAGIPPGSVGESYWNLHIPGVIIIHLLGGVFLRFLARLRERNPDDPLVCAIFVMLMVGGAPTSDFFVVALVRLSQLFICALFLLRARDTDTSTDLEVLGRLRSNI